MQKKFTIDGSEVLVQDFKQTADALSFLFEGKTYSYRLVTREGVSMILEENGVRLPAAVGKASREGETMIIVNGVEGTVAEAGKKMKKAGAVAGSLVSPMPGKIFKILKEVGSAVKKGEPILVLEAMKMEHSIRADKDGVVKNIYFQVGQLVQGGVALAEVDAT